MNVPAMHVDFHDPARWCFPTVNRYIGLDHTVVPWPQDKPEPEPLSVPTPEDTGLSGAAHIEERNALQWDHWFRLVMDTVPADLAGTARMLEVAARAHS